MIDLEQESGKIAALKQRMEVARSRLKSEKEAVAAATAHLEHVQAAQQVLQHLAQAVQQQAHERISRVVSSCLSAVFDDPYEFQIQFERKRGKTEARLRFIRDSLDVDPLTAAGGGLVDVAAFALRVACLVMRRPRVSRVVILDEPFRFVSREYQTRVRGMIQQLAKDMGIQIIMVTHNSNFVTGKVIQLER